MPSARAGRRALLLPHDIGNLIYTRYGAFADGIYFREPESRMYFMRKLFATRNYMSGYFWDHATDSFGFRNPRDLDRREILLLGDSLIYGHGVEEHETIRRYLADLHGIAAYNMGRQGDCLYNEYVLFRAFLPVFRPREVIIFSFLNDFNDLLCYRSDTELREIPELTYNYDRVRSSMLGPEPRYSWPLILANKTYTYALIRNSSRIFEAMKTLHDKSDTEPGMLRPFIDPTVDLNLLTDYTRRVLADMQARCVEERIRLRLVFIRSASANSDASSLEATERMARIIEAICLEQKIPFHDTRGILDVDETHYLPGDGHLSASGHRRLAAFVAERLDTKPPPADHPTIP
jgi:hypothetical protein